MAERTEAGPARRRVLIVDDDDAGARALTLLFERGGYDVQLARSASAAKDILARDRVDCAVIDFQIPDLRGDVLFAFAVAEQPHLADRTVFVATELTDRARTTIAEIGRPVVLMPLDDDALLGTVARFFEGGAD